MGGVEAVIEVLPCRRHGLTPREVRPRMLRRYFARADYGVSMVEVMDNGNDDSVDQPLLV